jgi:DNA polymerase V
MPHFLLVDCNNFYASCERLFNPKMEKRPIVVLSNNDGCVVARSQEAKQLGIKMGDPYFKIKTFCHYYHVAVYSSNYALYGNLSQRVMTILGQMAPEIEVYSIDEAFLTFPSSYDLTTVIDQGHAIHKTIKKWTSIPTSVGIGPTKTLAKMANYCAKKDRTISVFDLTDLPTRENILKKFPIQEIWGIGNGLMGRLNALGIYTAFELMETDPSLIRKKLGVVGERIV